MKDRVDKQVVGIVIGAILPMIATFTFYYFRYRYLGDLNYFDFLKLTFNIQGMGKLVSISVLPNLVAFLIALKIEYLWVVRGIIIPTFVYGVAAAVLALFF